MNYKNNNKNKSSFNWNILTIIALIVGMIQLLIIMFLIYIGNLGGPNIRFFHSFSELLKMYYSSIGSDILGLSILLSIIAIVKNINFASSFSLILGLFPVFIFGGSYLYTTVREKDIRLIDILPIKKYDFEFADVSFFNTQPSEGHFMFSSKGYIETSNEGEVFKHDYEYDKETNSFKTESDTIKVIHYDKQYGYVYCHYDKRSQVIISNSTPSEINDLFEITNDKFIPEKEFESNGKLLKNDGCVTWTRITPSETLCNVSKACLKNTDICNFIAIKKDDNDKYPFIYEVYNNEIRDIDFG